MIHALPVVKEEPFPPIPEGLLKVLNERFPERSPELKDSVRTIRYKSGQRSVVRFLNEQFARQNENILTTKTT